MTNPKLHSAKSAQCGVSRRAFLGASTLGGTALLATGWSALLQTNSSRAATADENAPWFEATIPQLQALMTSGALTSRALTLAYLQRIDRLNPLLNAVIETNPNAVAIATQLDNERRSGQLLGPLHGIPLLLKDNIATDDHLQTTAGSLALLHSRVPADAPLTNRLRAAGAVILGKANLSEWANFRGFAPCPSSWTCLNGWSGRGGFTQNPYILNWTACGSSSGSAVATATNLCAAAVGTETDGSITCPASNNLIVGLKPTVGLISQEGIIPIAHSQDTAGPMGRTVTDVAILLGALQTPFGSVAGASLPPEYTQFLRRGALRGARIGVDRKFFTLDFGGEAPFDAVAEHAIAVMRSLGATIVDPVDSGNPNLFGQAEFTVLLSEFKTQVAGYLANLNHTSMRTLADLIAFNEAHCPQEMKFYPRCPRWRAIPTSPCRWRSPTMGGRRAFGCTVGSCKNRNSWRWPMISSRRFNPESSPGLQARRPTGPMPESVRRCPNRTTGDISGRINLSARTGEDFILWVRPAPPPAPRPARSSWPARRNIAQWVTTSEAAAAFILNL